MANLAENADKGPIHDLLKKYGRNSMSSLLLYEGIEYYLLAGMDGFIGYYDTPKLLIGLGEPVCREEDYGNAIQEFVGFVNRLKKDCAFLLAAESFTDVAKDAGFSAIQIGDDFIFDVQTYAPRGDHAKKVRSATNQIRKHGAIVKEYDPLIARDRSLEDAFQAVADRWIRSGKFKIHAYFIGLKLFDFHAIKRYFYVEFEKKIVAILTCLPIYGRNGYLFEDLIRDPSAPNGASELMILEAIKKFREERKSIATFGISPKIDVHDTDGLSAWSKTVAHVTIKAANRLFGLRALYHHRKKFNTKIVEKCYLLKYPKRLRIADIFSILKTFNSIK